MDKKKKQEKAKTVKSPTKAEQKPEEETEKHPGWPDIDFKKTMGCGG